MREFGLDRETVDVEKCLEIEPALRAARPHLVGGDFTRSDESGDAHQFTRALAARAQSAGVGFCQNTTVHRSIHAGGEISGFEVEDESGKRILQADAYVMALGSYSPLMLKPLGITLPVYPAKGYSATLQLADAAAAPTVSLTDDEYKLVYSRLGNRLRIAGTAEFNGYNLDLNAVRCEMLMRRTRELFPNLAVEGEPTFWCGLRPATPSNVPYIGRSRYRNLWLNTGHGTLGWTMSCGSAAALADLISGKRPEPDFPFAGC
jgi:D-amino-acid dehydrogenase